MYNGRHFLRRQYVRLKGWLTLGSIGIMPRLILAFVAVGALAATANLIVENGVAILEQQRNVALERSTHDARQITALRESMERARLAAMSAEVLGALGEFDRAVQEHADADSRGSAARFFRARAALDRALARYLEDTRAAPDTLTRLVNEHKNSADAVVHTRRVRRDLLTEYSTLMSGMDIRVRTSMEQSLKVPGWAAAREPLLEIRARLDSVRAAFAARNAFDARELDTGPLAKAERALAATLREAYRHRRFPLSEINRSAGLVASGRAQLFDVTLSFERHDYEATIEGRPVKTVPLTNSVTPLPLGIFVREFTRQDDVQIEFIHRTDCLSPREVEWLKQRVHQHLELLLERPESPYADLPLTCDGEREQLPNHRPSSWQRSCLPGTDDPEDLHA